MAEFTFTFEKIPNNLDELKSLPEGTLDTGFKTAALVILALYNFNKNKQSSFDMLDYLKGPGSVSPYEKQFITERLDNKDYKIKSFFHGATPKNGYTPNEPLTITIYSNPYSFKEENYATIFVKSSGADSLREIKLRKKPSTGQWFLTEIQCLSDIRIPEELDPWA